MQQGGCMRHPARVLGMFLSTVVMATAAAGEPQPEEPAPDRGVKISGVPISPASMRFIAAA